VLGRTRRIHFVGVGGIGMSGIAELLANLGYVVTGSDGRRSDVTARLESACGVTVFEGHAAGNVGDAEVVVYSSAVKRTNPEIAEAERRGIPVIPRAEMLAELMRLRFSVAVAGSHGKTTTTSMIALVLERAGLDPTAVIGGRLSVFGSNARLGRGQYLVAEADESDRSFLMLLPSIAVMTNIDHEHMDTYGSFEELQRAFVEFANKVPFYGSVVACVDDPHVRAACASITRRVVSYGLDAPADAAAPPAIAGRDVELGSFGGRCTVHHRTAAGETRLGALTLTVPGRHNLQNALAVVAVAIELGIDFAGVAATLHDFHGAERRFERLGEAAGVLVVDDYGHHPTEIRATLEALRTRAGERRTVVLFQPHRYTRTQHLRQEFLTAFNEADVLVVMDIYAAGEAPIPGVSAPDLAEGIRAHGHRNVTYLGSDRARVAAHVCEISRPGDLVLTLGAGDVSQLGPDILRRLEAEAPNGRATC
jgi:UDP-N-acetylmuramate--alanine ligase